jgi:hypothetical protein
MIESGINLQISEHIGGEKRPFYMFPISLYTSVHPVQLAMFRPPIPTHQV